MFLPTTAQQLPTLLFVLSLFGVYGVLVRQGRIKDKNVLWIGGAVGLLSMAATFLLWLPAYLHGLPLSLALINPFFMLLCAIGCVFAAYRSQIIEDVAVYTLGDTKIIVRVCPSQRIPDAHALILPTDTTLRLRDGIAGHFGLITGGALSQELRTLGPAQEGQVVETSGGRTAVERIFHVAVSDNFRPVRPDVLRHGIESAAQAAQSMGAESVVLPIAVLHGLTVSEAAEIMVAGLLKQRRAFAEVVIAILNPGDKKVVAEIVKRRLLSEGGVGLPVEKTG